MADIPPNQNVLNLLKLLIEATELADQRERRNTLTLATISEMVREILLELRKPAPETSPLGDALRQLVTLVEHNTQALARIEADVVYLKGRLT